MKAYTQGNSLLTITPTCLLLLILGFMMLGQHVFAAPRPPQPPWPQPTLRTYGFDSSYWKVPLEGSAINEDSATRIESFSGYALVREGWMAAPVIIPSAGERKNPNIAPSYGSVRFWFAPNWSSAEKQFEGSGPGHLARLMEMVDFSGKTPVLRWSLYVNETGNAIYLSGQTKGGMSDLLQAPVEFQANEWHMITLCYSTTNVVLLIDNEIIASGDGLAAPSEAVAMNLGLVIGSDSIASLGSAAEAQFEEVTTMEHWPRKSDWQDMYFKGTKQRSLLGPRQDKKIEQDKIASLKSEGLLPEDYGMMRFYGGGSGTTNSIYTTNDLWLEIMEITNNYAYLVLHGTDENKWYQLLSKTNLAQAGPWTLGEAKQGDYGTNATGFSPVFVGDNTNMFFRAHQAAGYVTIQSGQTAYEPSVAMPGQSSDYYIYSSSPSAVTVRYQMSGVAQNGVDYTNLTGFVTIPATSGLYVEVQPKPDAVVEGDESIIMTLVQTNDYVILGDDHGQSVLKDYSTTVGIAGISHAIEASGPPGAPAVVGSVELNRYDYRNLYPPLTVRYSLSGTASNGVDYATLSGSVTFADQDYTANIDITPLSDSLIEGVETMKITLLTTNLYEVPPEAATNTVNITDTTTTIYVSVDQSAVEPHPTNNMPAQTGWFTISRDDSRGIYSSALPVTYLLSGTASNGVDYTNMAGTVTIPAGAGSTRVYIQPINDNQVEGTETVILTLLPTGDTYLIYNYASAATNTIVDTTTSVALSRLSDATEPNPSGLLPAITGIFRVDRADTRSVLPALTLSYTIAGSAQKGIDYTNITGIITIPANQTFADIFIQPLFDGQLEPDETVTLTLLSSNDVFVIVSGGATKTLTIFDNMATNIFKPVLTNLPGPVGIDYHQPSNSLIVSVNYIDGPGSGEPYNFARIYTNVVVTNSFTVTNVVVTNWSGIHGVTDEIKLVTIKSTANGFTNGQVYFGNGTSIGQISANGSISNLSWGILTNSTLPLRGGINIDTAGVFSNQIVAVTSASSYGAGNKGVWRVNAAGGSTLITSINTDHLEGVITLTNDVSKWGPLAGKLVTGDESLSRIFGVATNGAVTNLTTTTIIAGGIRPEDFEIVPANQDLYLCDGEVNTLVKLSHNYFTNYVGDLLITDAGEILSGADGKVFFLHWDSTNSSFAVRSLKYYRSNGTAGKFEHATFAPIDFPTLTP